VPAVVDVKLQLFVPVMVPPAGTVRLVHVAVRPVLGETDVVKVTSPELPAAP